MYRFMRHRSECSREIDRQCGWIDDWSWQSHAMAQGMDDRDAGFFPATSTEECAVSPCVIQIRLRALCHSEPLRRRIPIFGFRNSDSQNLALRSKKEVA